MHREIRRSQTSPGAPSVGLTKADTGSLLADPVQAAYPIGVAQQPYCNFATWVSWPSASPETAIVFYELDKPAIAFCLGRPCGIGPVIDAVGYPPASLYLVCSHAQLAEFERYYNIETKSEMLRMAVDLRTNEPETEHNAVKLDRTDAPEIIELLQPHGMRVDAVQLQQGRCFGVRLGSKAGKGELVSVAAAHFVATDRRLALLGNIVTRPDCRRRGYARAAVQALMNSLRSEVDTVCLDVNVSNSSAAKLYETLRFAPRHRHVEASAHLTL